MNNSDVMARIEPIHSNIDLKVLSSTQLDQIMDATLNVLENVGVRFPSDRALDIFEGVGPGGHFLSQQHNRSHLREIWIPDLTHPRIASYGTQNGDIRKRAKAKIEQILTEHEPVLLEVAARLEIETILRSAEAEYGR
jgi:trimethylamine--corrinoid protein Co-methyltransferase